MGEVSKVTCKGCSKTVVPRLWHEDMNSIIFYRKNQHICPICGITMYETGGGLTPIGYIASLFLGWVTFFILIKDMLNISPNSSAYLSAFLCLIIFSSHVCKSILGYGLVKLIRNKPWES